MNHQLLIPRRRSGFSPLSFGSDLALWLDPSYGVYTDRSTQLTAASSQQFTSAAAALISPFTGDFSFAYWIKPTTTATVQSVCGHVNYGLANTFAMSVRSDVSNLSFLTLFDSAGNFVSARGPAAEVAGSWSFVVGVYDSTTRKATLYRNAVAGAETDALPAAVGTGPELFRIGNAIGYFDGQIDSFAAYQKKLTGAEITALYNAGAGKVYSDLTDAQKVSLVSWYEFDGDGLDSHGSNDLTAVNSPTYTSGIASGVAGDGDVVSLVDARTGPNCGPPSYAGRPLWFANAGKPYFSFDGTNDGLQTASNISLGAFTIAGNFYASGTAGMLVEHSANGVDGGWFYGDTSNTIRARRSGVISEKTLAAPSLVDSTWRTFVHSHGGTQATHLLRLNGVNQSLSDSAANDVGDAAAADKLNIGARNNGASLPSTMRLGDLVAVNRVLTASELAQLESWLASRRAA